MGLEAESLLRCRGWLAGWAGGDGGGGAFRFGDGGGGGGFGVLYGFVGLLVFELVTVDVGGLAGLSLLLSVNFSHVSAGIIRIFPWN